MRDYSVTGLVLRAVDYKEKDKILTIFSLEYGKLTCVLKGVKGATSKLKYAGQPFCFGKFEVKKGVRDVITGCDQIDSFYDLTRDLDRYNAACEVISFINKNIPDESIAENVFLDTIKTLEALAYSNDDHKIILFKFYLLMLADLGYGNDYDICQGCAEDLRGEGNIYLDTTTGIVLCNECKSEYSIPISALGLGMIRIISKTDFDKLSTIKFTPKKLKETSLTIEKILAVHFGK